MSRKTPHHPGASRPRGRRSPWLLTGAIVASTALGRVTPAVEAAPVRANRYTDAIAYVLKKRLADLVIEPSWQLDLDAFRRATTQDPPKLQFAIPPGPLDAAIVAFEKATGLKIVVADEAIRTLTSP